MNIGSDTTSALLALALFTVFAILGFGWRSWAQHRATGTTGFNGVSGRAGSLEWLGGVGFIVAIIAAVAAPALQLAGVIAPFESLRSAPLQWAGVAIAAAGIAATVYAQLDMGDSWRIGVDRTETTTLVRSGVFGVVRNPIFAAMLLFGLGMALVTPNVVAVAGFLLLIATIELQVRVVEEPYLTETHGEDYRAYLASVGRFVPGVGITR